MTGGGPDLSQISGFGACDLAASRPIARRRLLILGVAAAAALTGCGGPTRRSPVPASPSAVSRAWSIPVSLPEPWATPPVTRYEAGLRAAVEGYLRPTPDHPGHPMYPGAVAFAAVDGRVAAHFAVGDAVRYAADKTELPAAERVPARPDTIYDLASLTKVFTAVLALRLVERGRLDLDAPAARYLPSFVDKPGITVRMLLTHTSGLSKDAPLAGGSPADQLEHVLREPPVAAPGSAFIYADQNFIALGAIVTELTGERLDTLVRTEIAAPLGMADTGYLPPLRLLPRIAATEGPLRGTVHDPAAAAFGGVSGHAGLFATAADLGLFGRALLSDGGPLLRPATVERMRANANAHLGPAAAHGLGVDVDRAWYMGRLAGHGAFGHTGFTGTSIVMEPRRGVVLVLLTNRVHPDAAWGGNNAARKAAADALAG
ncbi:serine hydrolase domain-containing protein [Dactylosporangium sp. NPDC051484]|uniref:serine hydrolase domain-containing protein n=1 Tax=Dactylosporangium sp. NPDC051484 TaxID=3154942 RepID=UPI0034502AE3